MPSASSTQSSVSTREKTVTYWIDERNGKFPLPWWKMLPLALLALLAVVGISTLWAVPHIEGMVEDDARARIAALGGDPGDYNYDATYRNIDIAGPSIDGVSAADFEAALEGDDSVRSASLALTAPVAPEPAEEEPAVEEEVAEEAPVEDPEPEVALGSTNVTATIDADGMVVLEGEVLNEAQRSQLVNLAIARFGEGNVTDNLTVSDLGALEPGASGRVTALGSLIFSLPEGSNGVATLTDTSLDFAGNVADEAAKNGLEGTLNGFGSVDTSSTLAIDATIIEGEIDTLQEEFDELEAEIRENVTFATGSDVLNPTATETLDKAVALMNKYSLPVVDISGHTDDQGGAAANEALSGARAAAVAQYLIDAGISEDRIQSRGLGESVPIADNGTEEGRQENRRVELVALASFADLDN